MMQVGTDVFINSKWWFDILSIKDGIVEVRVELVDGQWKKLQIDQDQFIKAECDCDWKISQEWLQKRFGGIVNKFKISKHTYSLFEDTSGMGGVAMAGLSGTPGVPGTSGSGDVGDRAFGPFIKRGTYGIEDLGKNIKTLKKLVKGGTLNKRGLKKPLLSILKEGSNEPDFLKSLYEFLDYPWSNDTDLSIISEINDWRPEFTKTSSQRIKQYLNDLWKINLFLIRNNCSDQFISQYMVIAGIAN